jgi:hypothetical protein
MIISKFLLLRALSEIFNWRPVQSDGPAGSNPPRSDALSTAFDKLFSLKNRCGPMGVSMGEYSLS